MHDPVKDRPAEALSPVADDGKWAEVYAYWYTPRDGSPPYLVIDVDVDADAIVKAYVNDWPLTHIEKKGA